MKRLFFIFVLFFLSAQLANAQEVRFPVLTGKKTEEAKKTADDKKQPAADSTKAKKKKLSILRIGADPVNALRMLEKDEWLVKYDGPRVPVKTQTGSGGYVNGIMTPGTILFVKNEVFQTGEMRNFSIANCGNPTEVLEREKGKSLVISATNLIKIVSYNELERLRKEKVDSGDNENFLKLSELLEKAFGDGGEIESMGDQLNSLSEKVDLLGKGIASIRLSLGFNESSDRNEKVESSSGDWWKWALGATAVILGGVITYKLLRQTNNSNPTIIINPPAGSGGPVNPHN